MQAVRVTGYILLTRVSRWSGTSRRSKLIAVVVPQVLLLYVDTIQSLSDELAGADITHICCAWRDIPNKQEAELVATCAFPPPPMACGAYRDPSHDRTEKGHPERGYFRWGGNLGLNAHASDMLSVFP